MPEVDSETNPPQSEQLQITCTSSPSTATLLPPSTWLPSPDLRPFTAPPTPNQRNPLRPKSVPLTHTVVTKSLADSSPPLNDSATDSGSAMLLNMINQLPRQIATVQMKQTHYAAAPLLAANDKDRATRPDRHLTDYTIANTDRFGLRLGDQHESATQLETTKTWHPHVYAKPPKAPTPHSIGDILGLQRSSVDLTATIVTQPHLIGDSKVSNVTSISQILNAKSTTEQLSVNARLIGQYTDAGAENRFGTTIRSGSMSECSEEDGLSAISDQPLNLSVARSERRPGTKTQAAVPAALQPARTASKTLKKGKIICIVLYNYLLSTICCQNAKAAHKFILFTV